MQQCKYEGCVTNASDAKKYCSSCECNSTLTKYNRCSGTLCHSDDECVSGRCYQNTCAFEGDQVCTENFEAPCGRCANVACDRDSQCQTGECVDSTKCYDPVFWVVILFVTLGVILIVVTVTTICLVRKRKK